MLRTIIPQGASPAPDDTDLLPGVYEGGMKVWEASIDLLEYLVDRRPWALGNGLGAPSTEGSIQDSSELQGQVQDLPETPENGMTVLELGCGHGLPGIMALQNGCRVCFSDYNREVLVHATMANVRAQVPNSLWDRATYYCGDWGDLSRLLEEPPHDGKFDLILTAETLYTTSVAEKIHEPCLQVLSMILRHLAPRGLAIVASKRFYFGTGGSTAHFRGLAAADGRLRCEDVSTSDTGQGNIREVIEVQWWQPSSFNV
ncbi:unnamed protein product [Discosporangium mesarthrocarpum]